MCHYIIRNERPEEQRIVEALVRESFWNVYRPGCLEHYVLHCFRDQTDFIPELDLVMECGETLIGQVMYVRSVIRGDDGNNVPIATLGPICIAPKYKRQGYGTILLRASLEKAKQLGIGAIVLTGNIGFYGKSGFEPAKTKGVRYEDDPGADYFLIAELKKGFLHGVSGLYRDPEGYFVDEEAVEKFDAAFPYKEKKKLPGQLF